jgi:psp operon transcriptional activator
MEESLRTVDVPPLIGESQSFATVLEQVRLLAPLPRPVLVVGERGTGKELVAGRLHFLSPRWDKPLIVVNCAALSESLLESELFGHELGAFTGAMRRRAGRFEMADGGTLFLDEISSASPAVQERILRVIEYGRFERLGGQQTIEVDVRVVAASNVDLPSLVAAGTFRADLLDRLSFDVISLPPLRRRPDDIPALAQHFGVAMAKELGWEYFPGFAPVALAALAAHSWPGNIRELRNVVERSVCRTNERDQPISEIILDPFRSPFRLDADRPAEFSPSATKRTTGDRQIHPGDLGAMLRAMEREALVRALEQARFNQVRAAGLVGMGYHQFRRQLRKHGLSGSRGGLTVAPNGSCIGLAGDDGAVPADRRQEAPR